MVEFLFLYFLQLFAVGLFVGKPRTSREKKKYKGKKPRSGQNSVWPERPDKKNWAGTSGILKLNKNLIRELNFYILFMVKKGQTF